MNTQEKHFKKSFGILLLTIGVLFALSRIAYRTYANYVYENGIASNWILAERASTIKQKSEYMDKFILALEKSDLRGTNSNLILQTPATSFNENLKALQSLQKRLADISGMDENGFAYQTAIQQITAQEQGEAHGVLDNISSCWKRVHFYTLWNPVIVIIFVIIQAILIVGGMVIVTNFKFSDLL